MSDTILVTFLFVGGFAILLAFVYWAIDLRERLKRIESLLTEED